MTNNDKTILYQQEMISYINEKKNLYNSVIEFLDNSDDLDDGNDSYFQELIEFASNQIERDPKEMVEFLQILKDIVDNHHREPNFFSKINQILQQYSNKIKQTLSNEEIFEIFENNKIFILFLLKNQILTITEPIYNAIIEKYEQNDYRFCYFFYPELEKFVGVEKMKEIKNELLLECPDFFDNYDKKRQEGENDSYICSLIRQDSIEEFVSFVNRTNYQLSSQIKPSLFETNIFLIENESTTLIEYSAFYGSILIFQYLLYNNVELSSSLWLYAIHSENAELIHLLEYNKVSPPGWETNENNDFVRCLVEAIKCHHNDIANYIQRNLFLKKINDQDSKDKIIESIVKHHNYSFFHIERIRKDGFIYLCMYNYDKIVDFILKNDEDEIKSKVIKSSIILI